MSLPLPLVISLLALPVPLPNPGAEQADGDLPAGVEVWTSAGVKAQFRRDTTTRHGGSASFHIRNEGTESPTSAGSAVFILSGPNVYPLSYTASAWVKTVDATCAQLGVRVRDGQGQWLEADVQADSLEGTRDWTQVRCTWSPPAGAATFALFLRVQREGAAWFDDVAVVDDFDGAARRAELNERLGAAERVLASMRAVHDPLAARVAQRLGPICTAARTFMPRLNMPDITTDTRAQWARHLAALDQHLDAAARIVGLTAAVADSGRPDADYVAGWADSMTHVFLRDRPFTWQPERPGRLLAVRGEVEALQLVLLPVRQPLQKVKIHVTALRPEGEEAAGEPAVIDAGRVAIHPVGFVKTTIAPSSDRVPVEHDYRGWWPDPLPDDFAFDVAVGDTQPVWLAVSVPRDLPAGRYAGHVRIEPANAARHELPITVTVADVTLPDSNPWAFRNLMSWWSVPPKQLYGDRWTPQLQTKFFDFLLDRRINVLSMYGNEPHETVENIRRFAARGQNVFLLDWYSQEGSVISSDAARMRQRLAAVVPELRERGWIDRAYVYGWDEIGDPNTKPAMYGELRYAAEVLRATFPGVRLISAGTDRTYGTDSPLSGLSNIAFCPHMRFDVAAARRAQAAGNQVWWYDIQWPIDQHLIRSRLIPWQTYKLGADGFLIWCLNRWKDNDQPIGQETLTGWNPALDNVTPNSSAMYVYPGTDGPVSSLRLENLRDGIEDYELMVEARRRGIAFEIDDELTAGLTQYTTDPQILRERRRRLIEALAERH